MRWYSHAPGRALIHAYPTREFGNLWRLECRIPGWVVLKQWDIVTLGELGQQFLGSCRDGGRLVIAAALKASRRLTAHVAAMRVEPDVEPLRLLQLAREMPLLGSCVATRHTREMPRLER